MKHSNIIKLFLNAVATWKRYFQLVKIANMRQDYKSKSILMRAMFYWRKEAEALKVKVDSLLGLV